LVKNRAIFPKINMQNSGAPQINLWGRPATAELYKIINIVTTCRATFIMRLFFMRKNKAAIYKIFALMLVENY
jgi:hypothetical protein